MTHLALDSVSFSYPAAQVDVTLRATTGERLVLLGPSGCGKSTTLRLIAGLIQPASGDITFDGASVLAVRPEDRGAVMVFQDHALFPFRSVGANVAYGLKLRKVAKPERLERMHAALAAVQLKGFADRYPEDLSGGERQRVALARAIVVEPRVLLLDEPLSSLDPELRGDVRDAICSVQRDHGITTVIVTHDHDEARLVADRVAVMIGGKIRQLDTPEAIFESPADREVARFVGAETIPTGTP